jgi:hypothetical protein
MPLIGLPGDAAGSCLLEVEAGLEFARRPAGVTVEVERGRVVSCVSRLEPKPGTYAVGSATRWFSAVGEGEIDQLRFGGGRRLAEGLVSSLHTALVSG